MGNIPLSGREYMQMVGRAGRAGIDSIGESILFINVSPGNNHIRDSCKSEKSAADAIKLSICNTEIVRSRIGNVDDVQSDKSDFMRMRSMRCALNHKIPSIVTFNHCVARRIESASVLNIQDPEKPIFSIFCTSLYPANNTGNNSGVGGKVICSKLLPTGTGVDRLILDLIGGRMATTRCELLSFMKCTLMSSMMNIVGTNNIETTLKSMINRSITFLQSMGFVMLAVNAENGEEEGDEQQDESTRILELTLFGDATHHTPFSIESAIFVREEFEKALPVINSRDELFACWLVAPVFSSITPKKFYKWVEFLKVSTTTTATTTAESNSPHQYINLSFEQSYFANMVGATPAVLIGYLDTPWRISNSNLWLPTQRFFIAMILCDIINEMPLRDVSFKYDVSLGELESLAIQSASHSGQLLGFCKRMKWHKNVSTDIDSGIITSTNSAISMLLKSVCSRISHGGVRHELLSIMRINGIAVSRARSLFDAGFKNLNCLATANPSTEIAPIISRNNSDNELVIKLSILIVDESRRLLIPSPKEQSPSLLRDEDSELHNDIVQTIHHASSFTLSSINSEMSQIEFALTELDDVLVV
jgi:replicative superfamily II helicase